MKTFVERVNAHCSDIIAKKNKKRGEMNRPGNSQEWKEEF
jgi:hypothetical protein